MVIRPSQSGRNWNALSENYRNRLERNGITRRDYERGVSLSTARGHAHTPEKPERAERNGRYEEYRNRRNAIADRIEAFTRERWGDSPKYNARTARRAAFNNNVGVRGEKPTPRTMANLKAVLATIDDYDAIDPGDIPDDISDAFHYH